ncbi:TetR/AcrR family transcriptional regulator [Streptomyces olivaceoviridis]
MKSRPYHHGDLPATLLAHAERMVRQRGWDAVSLREIARDIGVSPAAPSRHFKSKQALLDALALTGFQRLAEVITVACKGADGTFAERLSAVVRGHLGFARANGALFDLMLTARHSPQASLELREAAQRWSEPIVALIADGQRTGEVREGTPERVAFPVLAALHGYTGLTLSGAVPPEQADHGLADVVASMVRACAP